MGAQFSIVPIADADLEFLEATAAYSSEEAVAAVESIKRGIAGLTPAQRKASKYPSPAQVRAAVLAAGTAHGIEVEDLGGKTSFDMSLSVYKDAKKKKLLKSLTVCVLGSKRYYLEGNEDLVGPIAAEIAKLAGPQVSFATEDGIWADVTKLHVAGEAPAPTKKVTRKKR